MISEVAASQRLKLEELGRRHASAAEKRADHLRERANKALNENKKVDEVMFIDNLSRKNDEMERVQNLRRRIQESENRRRMYLASVRQRALQISTKEEKVAERKRLLELERTRKIEEAEQRRLAARERKANMTPPAGATPSLRVRVPPSSETLERRRAEALVKMRRKEEHAEEYRLKTRQMIQEK